MTLFSIIVPVYNVENFMRDCVDSILSQSCSDFELILVNDGSTDKSGEICNEYEMKDYRVKVYHQMNGGASKARNTGLKKASGEYVYFVDSDDYLANEYVLEKIESIVLNNSSIDLVKIKQIAFKDNADIFYAVYKYKGINIIDGLSGLDAMLELCKTNQMVISAYSYFIKRKTLIDNEIYFVEGVYSEDINWTPRVFMASSMAFTLDEFAYCRRQNRPGQVTFKANLKRDLDCATIIDDWFKQADVRKNAKEDFDYFWNYLSTIYIEMVGNQYLYKNLDARIRLSELEKYSYIFEYNTKGKFKNIGLLYRIFGYKACVYLISNTKKIYRALKK